LDLQLGASNIIMVHHAVALPIWADAFDPILRCRGVGASFPQARNAP
jgi:hypothetical protein